VAHDCAMMRRLAPVPLAILLVGCAVAVPPVDVTRFHAPALATLAPGTAYRFADAQSLTDEAATYRTAVDGELRRVGFIPASDGAAAPLVIRLTLNRSERRGEGAAPVSVGVGGSTGSYGSGVGLGIGLNLGGGPRSWTDLTLAVRIDDAASSAALWEGRAIAAIPSKAPGAQPSLAAAKLAKALFTDFPGTSGQTISVP
jgi:hypothetical protein